MSQTPYMPAPPMPAPPTKGPWWKSRWLIGAAALLVGFAGGMSAAKNGSTTASPQATATVTATVTPESDPLATSDAAPEVVEGEPVSNSTPAKGTFTLGEPYTLEDGSTLTIGQLEPIVVDRLNDDGMDSHYRFTVSYTNNAQEPWNPFNLTIQGTTGTVEAPTFFSHDNGCSLVSTDVLPGKTLEWPVCIGANKADGLSLQWSILFGDRGWVDVELP